MFEIVGPAFLKPFLNELAAPEVSGLRCAIGPRQAVRRGTWYHGVDDFSFVARAEHDGVAADPVTFRMLLEVVHHCVESARKINVVTINESANVAGRLSEPFVYGMDLAAVF